MNSSIKPNRAKVWNIKVKLSGFCSFRAVAAHEKTVGVVLFYWLLVSLFWVGLLYIPYFSYNLGRSLKVQ